MAQQSSVVVEWLCSQPSEAKFPGRVAALEKICRDAALLNGWTVVGIRALDHKTTRTGRGRNKFIIQADPHITVYVGYASPIRNNFTGEGHLYIIYDNGLIPSRLALVSELPLSRHGVNPEIWDRSGNLINTVSA